MQRLIS